MLKTEDMLAYQQALAKSMKPIAGAQEDALYKDLFRYATAGTVLTQAALDAAKLALQRNNGYVYYTGSRQGKPISQLLMQQWTGTLPSKRAKGVRDAPHIAVEVKDDTLHLTAVNTQLGLHGLLPKMKASIAPKWLTDKVAVLHIMEPYHDWVEAIGQRTGEHCFLVLCPYKYAPRKERTKW